MEAIAHYFRIQSRFFELQEKEGVDRAYDLFNVTKRDLLAKMASRTDEDNDTSTLMEMIDRHVFAANPWNADIELNMDVVLSGMCSSYFRPLSGR